jgi:iron complex transport system substrate-binding protein
MTNPMRGKLFLGIAIFLVFAGSFLAKGLLGRSSSPPEPPIGQPQRIVSMAPSITETLFALGLGDRVVGVTRYCSYPDEAKSKACIGGYLDPNFEAIVLLKPDLVVLLVENEQSMPALRKLRLRTLAVCHQTVEGILASIDQLGRSCGRQQQAQQILADIRSRLDRVHRKTAGLKRPKVLFAVERTLGAGHLEDVYVAGANGFFDRIVTLAGGRNACPDCTANFPVVSTEGILRMNPEVILDMVSGLAGRRADPATIRRDWQQLDQVDAVANGRVHVIQADYAFVPGPRFILLVEDLARLIHPEVDWDH